MSFIVKHNLNVEDYPDTYDDTEIKNCRMCIYSERTTFNQYKCNKNNFILENIYNSVCNNFKGNDIYLERKKCGFRYIK